MQRSLSALVGAALLVAVAEGSVLDVAGNSMRGDVSPDCKNLYTNPNWGGGTAKAMQGNFEYTWSFYPCSPHAANSKCNQPPYAGNVFVSQLQFDEPNPCAHQLFCEASPEYVRKNSSTGVVTYEFPQCVPSQTGAGPSPRSATVEVHCDSQVFRVDPVLATKLGNGGWHFSMNVHGPCGAVKPPPPPPVACPPHLAGLPPVFFTQPLNPKSTGDVYEWGVNLCNSTNPTSPALLALDTATGKETTLNVLSSVHTISNGWEFHLTSSMGPDTGVITVEKAAGGGPCRYLSPPADGVTATVNRNLGAQLSMTLTCM